MTASDVNEPSGAQLRDQGTAAVLAADVSILRYARPEIEDALDRLIAAGRPFTADHVRELLPDDLEPHHPNVYGAAINHRRRLGDIRCVGYATSTRRSRHAGLFRVWVAATDAIDLDAAA